MKKIFMSLALLGAMACQQDKIGFVDNVKLMKDYQEQIDIQAKFKTKVDALTKQRDSISQAFQAEAQAFQVKAANMAQKDAQEQYGQLQQRGQMIGQQLQQQEQQLQMGSQKEMDSLISKVKREIASYGKANGYTFILGGGEGGSVLYGDSAKDLTADIIKLLNEKYKK